MADNPNEQINQYLDASGPMDAAVEQAITEDIEKDIELEIKYGDSPVEAALGEAASAATLGLSDQVLVKAGVDPERLRETRERSPVAAGLGMAGGIVVPALASGGTSTAAQVTAKAAPGVLAATRAGKAAETVVAGLLKDRVRSKAAKTIIETAAQNAAEGAVFGAGQLVSEDALGKADLNAQNLVASAGAGALLGAGFGGALGGAKATVPLVRKGTAPIGEKLSQAAKNLVDPERAAMELVGLKADKLAKIHEYNPNFGADLPAFITNKLALKPLTSADELVAANKAVRNEAGAKIGSISDTLDEITKKEPGILPERIATFKRLEDKLTPYEEKLMLSPEVNRAELRIIKDFKKDLNRRASLADPAVTKMADYSPTASFRELDDLRKTYQKIKYKPTGAASENFRAQMAELQRSELRNIVDETAQRVELLGINPELKTLAADLKAANADFAMSSTLNRFLPKTLNKKAMLGLQDIIEGSVIGGVTGSGPLGIAVAAGRRFAKSDLKRRLTILADIKAQGLAIDERIKSAVKTFVTKSKAPARQLSLKSLVNSGFAVDFDNNNKVAKNRVEALRQVAENLNHLGTDQDALLKKMAASTARIGQAAPNIAQEAQYTMQRSLEFLRNKLPSRGDTNMLFKRPWEPSSMEIAKFERYMQAVEHPLSVLEDLEHGTLTREHVEALQAVYPALYKEVQQVALNSAIEQPDKMSYGKKVQLSILLGVTTDQSLEPASIAALQSNFIAQNTAVEEMTTSDVSGLDVASRAQSGSEKVANRS